MQQIALFRKLIIKNKAYYQLYDIKEDFEVTDQFAKFDDRAEKDYFYISINNEQINIFENCKYIVFTEENNQLSPISDDEELHEVFNEFKEHFKDLETIELQQINPAELIYNEITRDVLFQDDVVIDILESINRNQDILTSDIPEKNKIEIKDNIVLYGLPGCGKNTLINALQENLDIPFADIKLVPDLETNVAKIVNQLGKNAGGDLSKIKNGIVYIRDNFDELANFNDELSENPFIPLFQLMSGIRIFVGEDKTEVDFSHLTFVIVLNVPSLEEIEDYLVDFNNMPNIHLIFANELTPKQQKEVLLKSKHSVINVYKNILKKLNKKLIIQKGFLDELILISKNINGGMKFINDVIGKMIKNEWYNESSTIRLTNAKLKEILKYFDEVYDITDNIPLEEIPKEESNELDYNLEQLVNIIKQNVRSQDEHVKRILYTILRNRYAANSSDLENPKRYIKNMLIRGESGSGKTLILTEIAKLLKLPIFIADATSYTEAGYVGNSVTDMLTSLYKAANGDLEKAERGILVVDEIDKKSGSGTDSNVTRGAVLDGLLKIIEGTVIPLEVGKGLNSKQIMFDTSRLTVICSGAFENIEQYRDQRMGVKKTMGFGSAPQAKPNQDPKIIDEDYVRYGMNRQFMARLGVIVNLNKLETKDLKNIMQNSKTSELIIQQKLSSLEGVELVYEDGFYDALAEKAYNKKIGARGIERAFNEVLDNIHFIDIDSTIYSKVIFTSECVNDPSKVILVERDNTKKIVVKKKQ